MFRSHQNLSRWIKKKGTINSCDECEYDAKVDNFKRNKHSQHEGGKLVNTATDSNKAVDDNIKDDMNNKTEDVEKM